MGFFSKKEIERPKKFDSEEYLELLKKILALEIEVDALIVRKKRKIKPIEEEENEEKIKPVLLPI